jgi:Clostripain family
MAQSVATQIMLYMSAQNELSDKAVENIQAIEKSVSLDDICTYIMLDKIKDPAIVGRDAANTLQYKLPPGASTTPFQAEGFGVFDKDVTDPKVFKIVLREAQNHFQRFAGATQPRQKLLIFWGHGGGMVMLDEQQEEGVNRARANMKAFADVLVNKAEGETQLAFDIIAFDSCYMCMIETMHELRDTSAFALCSSTMVDADGYPYEDIFHDFKTEGRNLDPAMAAQRISTTYNNHYLQRFPDGNRFLFVCEMNKVAACIDALNDLGQLLISQLSQAEGDDPVRTAIREALIAANADSAYVYILRFLKLLAWTMDGCVTAPQHSLLVQQSDRIRQAVKFAFKGNLGDTTDNPVSPLIWVPFQINSFIVNEANYNILASSQNGTAGWARFWRLFHRRDVAVLESMEDTAKSTLGFPVTKQLAN